jgi:DNA-binding response OmpR family regulator
MGRVERYPPEDSRAAGNQILLVSPPGGPAARLAPSLAQHALVPVVLPSPELAIAALRDGRFAAVVLDWESVRLRLEQVHAIRRAAPRCAVLVFGDADSPADRMRMQWCGALVVSSGPSAAARIADLVRPHGPPHAPRRSGWRETTRRILRGVARLWSAD